MVSYLLLGLSTEYCTNKLMNRTTAIPKYRCDPDITVKRMSAVSLLVRK